MDEGTRQIRQDIERTRERVGEEVEALSHKTDVGARLDEYVDDKKEAVRSKVRGAKETVVSAAGSVQPGKRQMRMARRTAERNPLGLVVGGAAVGFVAGLLIPSTRSEDEHIGDAASRLKSAASDAGEMALERGKDVAQTAVETAVEEAGTQGRELASDLKDRVQHEAQGEQVAS